MQKTKDLIDTISEKYLATTDHIGAGRPRPILEMPTIRPGFKEIFHLRYEGGRVKLLAESPLAAVYGMNQAIAAIRSGHLVEFLGDSKPRFPLRPVWVKCEKRIKLLDQVLLSIPEKILNDEGRLDEEFLSRFTEKVLELGYNAVVFGHMDPQDDQAGNFPSVSLKKLADALHAYGVKLIVRPHLFDGKGKPLLGCPVDKSYREKVKKILHDLFPDKNEMYRIDEGPFFYRESNLYKQGFDSHPQASDYTLFELLLKELELFEECLYNKATLIFYLQQTSAKLAKKQSRWFRSLCDFSGTQTILAFSANTGDPRNVCYQTNPFWNQLRESKERGETPIMPIINAGGIGEGEGVWPAFSRDTLDLYFSRMTHHEFFGAIILTPQLPGGNGVLACNLWTAGQLQWRSESAACLMETWCLAFRPEWELWNHCREVKRTRAVLNDIACLVRFTEEESIWDHSVEMLRSLGEGILHQLEILRIGVQPGHPLYAYYRFFIADVKRLLQKLLGQLQVVLPALQLEGEGKGFWCKDSNPLRDKMIVDDDDPEMAAIYKENHL